MTVAPDVSAVVRRESIDAVALDPDFQAALQRYAQENGSSHAVACAAARIAAEGHDRRVAELLAANNAEVAKRREAEEGRRAADRRVAQIEALIENTATEVDAILRRTRRLLQEMGQ